MNNLRHVSRSTVLFATILSAAFAAAQTPAPPTGVQAKAGATAAVKTTYPPELVKSGGSLFRQDCAFCHGRDATGGESGPDLTRSKLVRSDIGGDKIGAVVRSGRPDKGMPPFDRTDDQIAALAAFIHTQQQIAQQDRGGGRKGVDVADLQTGNLQAGKEYFNGAGGCAKCHSPSGDLAGVATRYKGLELEEQMLYPRHVKSKVMVTPNSGEAISGTLAYEDEFVIALIDASDNYHSWRKRDVQFKIDAPVSAHAEQLPKYTDADVHNLMAYIQTLK